MPDFTFVCSPGTCGGDSCSINSKRDEDLEQLGQTFNETLSLVEKRGDPAKGEWADPADYNPPSAFMPSEVQKDYVQRVHLPTNDESEETTSNHVLWQDKVTGLAIAGLHGCTGVFVVSKYGAWGAHYWQHVLELDPNDAEWTAQVAGHTQTGLQQLLSTVGGEFTSGGEGFAADARVFIFTPGPHIFAQWDHSTGTDLNEAARLAPRVQSPTADYPARYASQVNSLQAVITNVLGQVPVDVFAYNALQPPAEVMYPIQQRIFFQIPSEIAQAQQQGDLAKVEQLEREKTELAWRLNNEQRDPGFRSPRGKILVQYKPGKFACGGPGQSNEVENAAWRFMIEGNEQPFGEAEWEPELGQYFTGAGGQRKRQDGEISCPVPPTSSSSSSVSSASSTSSSSSSSSSASSSSSTTPSESASTTTSSAGPPATSSDAPSCKQDSDCVGNDEVLCLMPYTFPVCSDHGKCICEYNKHPTPPPQLECEEHKDCVSDWECPTPELIGLCDKDTKTCSCEKMPDHMCKTKSDCDAGFCDEGFEVDGCRDGECKCVKKEPEPPQDTCSSDDHELCTDFCKFHNPGGGDDVFLPFCKSGRCECPRNTCSGGNHDSCYDFCKAKHPGIDTVLPTCMSSGKCECATAPRVQCNTFDGDMNQDEWCYDYTCPEGWKFNGCQGYMCDCARA